MPEQDHERFMRRALELARRGTALASPNPYVGAVIVDSTGQIAGEGFHTYDGIKHAEVLAAEQAGGRTHPATLYLNLEPCSPTRPTGRSAAAMVPVGIHRVHAA